jgi:membrane associated rhomboid family serine protease
MAPSSVRILQAPPYVVVLLLAIVEATMFVLSAFGAGSVDIPAATLIADGALYEGAISNGEVYRFITYGFLHANLTHLTSNLTSLAVLGPFLETRLRPAKFLGIYVVSLLGAGVASLVGHSEQVVIVGASGGLFGLLGCLFALWFMGKAKVSPLFFVVNLGLNLYLALSVQHINQFAHAGGFVVGVLVTFGLAGLSRLSGQPLLADFAPKMPGLGASQTKQVLPLSAKEKWRKLASAMLVALSVAAVAIAAISIDRGWTPVLRTNAVVTAKSDHWSQRNGNQCKVDLATDLGPTWTDFGDNCLDIDWNIGQHTTIDVQIGRVTKWLYVIHNSADLRNGKPSAWDAYPTNTAQ